VKRTCYPNEHSPSGEIRESVEGLGKCHTPVQGAGNAFDAGPDGAAKVSKNSSKAMLGNRRRTAQVGPAQIRNHDGLSNPKSVDIQRWEILVSPLRIPL